MFGIVPDGDLPQGEVGIVWMLCSEAILEFRTLFARESRLWHGRLVAGCSLTWNVVDCRNTVHIRWLRWLGYSFLHRHDRYGFEQRPFFEFVMVH